MANSFAKAILSKELKNGTMLVGCPNTGFPSAPSTIVYDRYVTSTPSLTEIQNKYNNRFYNGIFVNVLSGALDGGTSEQ